jgi:hypothetical protein
MYLQMKQQIEIGAPARDVRHIVAHQFDQIGQWASSISVSESIAALPVPDGAPVGGRACYAPGFGGDAQEKFTYYDEEAMRFGYQAIGKIPLGLKCAENNWAVHPVVPHKSVAEFRAEIDYDLFPGLFMAPLLKVMGGRMGGQLLEELKYYVEEGKPHPRKVKALQKQPLTA